MASERLPLSVAIITKNEEARLPACLESVSFCRDIVVVDSGSTDRTAEVARDFGCRVFVEEWKGYGPQKNSALSRCSHDWTLLLDADERLGEGGAEAIAAVLLKPEAAAYTLKRKNFLHGRWLRHSGSWPDRQVRLVNRLRGAYRSVIHESWETDGPVVDLDAHLEHHAFSGYADMLRTMDEYSTIIAREFHAEGRRANPLSPVWHGAGMFLKIYLVERGFLDGMDGLVTALAKAGGSFFKYAKLLEMQQQDED